LAGDTTGYAFAGKLPSRYLLSLPFDDGPPRVDHSPKPMSQNQPHLYLYHVRNIPLLEPKPRRLGAASPFTTSPKPLHRGITEFASNESFPKTTIPDIGLTGYREGERTRLFW
jgi:hypothetical protein